MDTLVLDSRCLPADCISWQRTMTHVAASQRKKHIRVVSEYSQRIVRGVGRELKLPAAIQRLPGEKADATWTHRIVKRGRGIRFGRQSIFACDGGRCQYCLREVANASFSVDPVIPRVHGGITSWENVVTACMACNQRKGGRTPTQSGLALAASSRKPMPGSLFAFEQFEEGMPEDWRPWLPAGRDAKASALNWRGRLRVGRFLAGSLGRREGAAVSSAKH